MSSLLSALNSATAGLRTVQSSLATVTGNIAGLNDPSRTRHTLQPSAGAIPGPAAHRREMDEALRAELESLGAREGASATRDTYLRSVGDLLGTTGGKPTLDAMVTRFQKAWKALATTPESAVAQRQAVQAADGVAHEMRRVAEGVETLGRTMRSDLATSVDKANHLLREIGSLDTAIGAAGGGDAALTLADRRDDLVRRLGTFMEVRRTEGPGGRIKLFTPSGMSLLDGAPVRLELDGTRVTLRDGDRAIPVDQHMTRGRIGALLGMLRDGSTAKPPTNPDGEPAGELIRKLRSQLDALSGAFSGASRPGQPASLKEAYDGAGPARKGEVAGGLFVGSNRFTLTVNPALLDGGQTIKRAALGLVDAALAATGRTLDADGLSRDDTSVSGMVSAFTGNWAAARQAAKEEHGQNVAARGRVEERYRAKTGVNLDEEIATLQQLQTSYAASARVMKVIQSMHETLEALVR